MKFNPTIITRESVLSNPLRRKKSSGNEKNLFSRNVIREIQMRNVSKKKRKKKDKETNQLEDKRYDK
jgi:hypothetical protein